MKKQMRNLKAQWAVLMEQEKYKEADELLKYILALKEGATNEDFNGQIEEGPKLESR